MSKPSSFRLSSQLAKKQDLYYQNYEVITDTTITYDKFNQSIASSLISVMLFNFISSLFPQTPLSPGPSHYALNTHISAPHVLLDETYTGKLPQTLPLLFLYYFLPSAASRRGAAYPSTHHPTPQPPTHGPSTLPLTPNPFKVLPTAPQLSSGAPRPLPGGT